MQVSNDVLQQAALFYMEYTLTSPVPLWGSCYAQRPVGEGLTDSAKNHERSPENN